MGYTDPNEDFTGILVKDTYQSVIHIGGTGSYSASLYDGTGSLVNVSWNNFSQSIHGQDVTLGDVTVNSLTTDVVYITEVSRSVIYESGSTKFGDTSDDKHQFTGSVCISGSLMADSFSGSLDWSYLDNVPDFVLESETSSMTVLSSSYALTASYLEGMVTSSCGRTEVEYFTLTSTDITNKYVTLSDIPTAHKTVIVDSDGAGTQILGPDYIVSSSNIITWDGLGMEAQNNENDTLRISYTVLCPINVLSVDPSSTNALSASYAATSSYVKWSNVDEKPFSLVNNLEVFGIVEVIDMFPTSSGVTAEWLVNVHSKYGSNMRTSKIISCWLDGQARFTEHSTQDIGDTKNIEFTVDVSGSFVRLLSINSVPDDWEIKTIKTII